MSKEDTTKAVGKLLTEDFGRDAIHVAVAPVEAGEKLAPGQHIGIGANGKAFCRHTTSIGIVDPFLSVNVQIGERFFIFLYPGTITSLRHEWEHPAFKPTEAAPTANPEDSSDVAAAKRRIAVYADAVGLSYDRTMEAAEDWLRSEEYHIFNYDTPDEAYTGAEAFWNDYEIVTGKKVEQGKKQNFFSCSC